MTEWAVCGRGTDVMVTSPEGDVYPFEITSPAHLDLELKATPDWHDGRVPKDAGQRIDAALGEAVRWTHDTFGEPRA